MKILEKYNISYLIKISIFIILSLGISNSAYSAEIKITFDNIRNDKGSILILIFNQADGFPDKHTKAIRQYRVSVKKAREGVKIDSLVSGYYAISAVHDENSNSKLDKNFMGIPKEGVGFSNNPKILFSAPNFKKSKFLLNRMIYELNVKMIYF